MSKEFNPKLKKSNTPKLSIDLEPIKKIKKR